MDLDTGLTRQMLGDLRKKQMQLRIALEKVNKAINALEDVIATDDPIHPTPAEARPVAAELVEATLPEAAAFVLREIQRPMHVYELITELQARGFRSDQNKESFRMSLVGTLARKARAQDTFISVRPGTYALREWIGNAIFPDWLEEASANEREARPTRIADLLASVTRHFGVEHPQEDETRAGSDDSPSALAG